MGLSSVPRPFLYIVMFIQLDCETVSGIEMENNAAINPVAGTFGVIYWTQMKKPITSDRLKLKNGSGEWNRTIGLQVMSLTSYHCSTPQYLLQDILIYHVLFYLQAQNDLF